MLRFDNPGHRAKLHELGILAADQLEIAPADLAQRIIACPKPDEALYILQQEIRTQLTNFLLLDSQLAITQDFISAVIDLPTLTVAIERYDRINDLLIQIETTQTGFRQVAETINQAIAEGRLAAAITSQTRRHLEALLAFDERIAEHAKTEGRRYSRDILELGKTLQSKIEMLKSD